MRILKKIIVLILAVLLLPVLSHASADSVFIRIDRDDPNAWKEELANVRFLQEEGMSGSAQFSGSNRKMSGSSTAAWRATASSMALLSPGAVWIMEPTSGKLWKRWKRRRKLFPA